MRSNRQALTAAAALIVGGLPILIFAFSGGPPPRRSGAPGDGLCTACHAGAPNPAGGKVEVSFPGGLSYTPGVKQQWTVTLTDPQARLHGFQLTTRLASDEVNGQAGDLNPVDSSTQVICENGSSKTAQGCPAGAPVQFVEHFPARTRNTFTFSWTPPDRDVGNVRVYVAGNGANGDGTNSGDHIYTNSYTLTPAPAQQERPSISAENGVLNGASFKPGIASGSWASIFGRNLATSTRIWRNDEIVDGKLPTQLDGVRVTINGKPAAIYFISPAQLNVQVPTDDALGSVAVQVTTAQGTSNTVATQMQAFAPAFFTLPPENGKYAAAQHTNYDLVAKPGLYSGVSTRGARPGEVILLYGTGFGPTQPSVPSGQVVTTPASLANAVTVRIGGALAEVTFAGLTGAGLYQLNVKVPDTLADGDAALIAEVGGVRTPDGVFITVQK